MRLLRISRVPVLVVGLLSRLLGGDVAVAHEFWVQPDSFTPSPGDRVPVRLFVGEAGKEDRDEMARRSDHLLRFEAISAAGSSPIVGLFGRAPAGMLRPTTPGHLLIVYQGKHTFIEIAAEKFESYLDEEGLDEIIEARVRTDESLAPGRESYARYAKSLVVVQGDVAVANSGFDREVGMPIEVVPETNPQDWSDGDPFVVRVLYDGRPLADQQLKLIHLVDGDLKVIARTDVEGRATLQPAQAGPWLVATVYMRRAPEGVKGDWESFWGSLTFELASRPQP